MNTGTASYFDFDDDVHNNKNNSTTNNSNNVLVVIRPSIKVLYIIFGVVKSDNRLSTVFKLKMV